MLTPSAEAVLLTLHRTQCSHPQRLKMTVLAKKASVCRYSAIKAVTLLVAKQLITAHHAATTGPDAVYAFALTDQGRTIANYLSFSYERRA